MALSSTPITAELVRGAVELERTEHGVLPHRLPRWARDQCQDPQLLMAESQPAGVRLRSSSEIPSKKPSQNLPGKASSRSWTMYTGQPIPTSETKCRFC